MNYDNSKFVRGASVLSLGSRETEILYLIKENKGIRNYQLMELTSSASSSGVSIRVMTLKNKGFINRYELGWKITELGLKVCSLIDDIIKRMIKENDL